MLRFSLFSTSITLFTILFFSSACYSQTDSPAADQQVIETESDSRNLDLFEFRSIITADLLETHLEVLAGESMMGRGTGQEGIDLAADYLASWLEKYNVAPMGDDGSYFQHFDLMAMRTNEIVYTLSAITATDTTEVWSESASRFSPTEFYNDFGGEISISGGITFAGLGISDEESGLNHLQHADINNNWVVMFRNFHEDTELPENAEALLQRRAQQLLFRQGARGLLVIDHPDAESFETEAMRRSRLIGKPSGIRLPDRGGRSGFASAAKSVSPDMAVRLLGLDSLAELDELHRNISQSSDEGFFPDIQFYLATETRREEVTLPSKNVIGFVEGCHPELKDEVIVMSAHYDHMGIGQPDETGDMVYNGADDNGSGTVTTLLQAKTIQQAKENGHCLDRSIMFLFVTAEEHGLLGSRYYSDNPVIPISETVANFNLDMFGRIDYEYEGTDEDYIYIIGAEIISSDLDRLLKQANEQTENLTLDMRYNDLDDRNQFYRRSDHWNFGRLNVPFIFFFSGLHDNYHTPSDTIDLIPFDLLEKRARLIYSTLVEVANSPVRPVVDNEAFIERTR